MNTAISLNEDQQAAYNHIARFFQENSHGIFGLFGAAGTGKTTTIAHILSKAKNPVAAIAYTNKAKNVLQERASTWSDNISVFTIHSFFALQIREDDKIIQDPKKMPKFEDFGTIVIDECSMISDKLYDYIISKLKNRKIIILGDHCQLPPVGQSTYSKAFALPHQYTLTKVMRFEENSDIFLNSMRIRQYIEQANYPSIKIGRIRSFGKGNVSIINDYEQFLNKAYDLFRSPEYQINPDLCKILVINNDEVKKLNWTMRNMLFGNEQGFSAYMSGEILIAQSPIMYDGRIYADTSDQLIVNKFQGPTDVSYTFFFNNEKVTVSYKALTIEVRNITKASFPITIHVLQEDQQEEFFKDLKFLASQIQPETKFLWREYYHIKEKLFAFVDYNYAITLHKSQGSTYDHVFLHEKNIEEKRNKVFKNETLWKAKYVAITRPSKSLSVFNE